MDERFEDRMRAKQKALDARVARWNVADALKDPRSAPADGGTPLAGLPVDAVEAVDEETLREMFPEKACINCGFAVQDHDEPADHHIEVNFGPNAGDVVKGLSDLRAEEDEDDE